MSEWTRPEIDTLQEVIRSSSGNLVLCSPFIRREVLEIVQVALPPEITEVEVWTRLSFRDWLTGASEPDGLLDFRDEIVDAGRQFGVRQGSRLHAKVVLSDGELALAGSANLTMGGFRRNLELVRVVDGAEVGQLRGVVNQIRPELTRVTTAELRDFVTQCSDMTEVQEALLDLIREESPPDEVEQIHTQLLSYREFWTHLEESDSPLASEVLRIAKNLDRNNNTGKVKQAFFGVQRFLQEYPRHRRFVEALDDRAWFDVRESPLFDDWGRFLNDFAEESNVPHRYSIRTLRSYLTESSGGTRTGGGGGDNELKRVWPFVGRAMREREES